MLVVYALGACHPQCPWCAREFWKWMAGRMRAMDTPSKRHPGKVTFAQAAATSVVAK